MIGFYSNAFRVGASLLANIRRFNGWGARAVFVDSAFRHFLVLVFRLPLKPRTRTLRFSGLEIRFKEFTGELGNVKTVFFDEDESLPVPAGAVAYDVGANIGLFTLYLVWKYGRSRFREIHLFEPNPEVFERLLHNLRANGLEDLCRAYPVALSDRAGEVFMEAPHGYSVLGTISDKGVLPVRCETLDAWAEANGAGPVDLLKVDVEGHELALWRGATRFLARTRRVYIEVKQEHLPELLSSAAAAGFSEAAQQTLGTGVSMILLERAESV